MTQIGADEKIPLTWVTKVPDSVIINFDVNDWAVGWSFANERRN
jgi:hypothetical protein